jgi:hypothetical protein
MVVPRPATLAPYCHPILLMPISVTFNEAALSIILEAFEGRAFAFDTAKCVMPLEDSNLRPGV